MIFRNTLFGKELIGWKRKWIELRTIDNSIAITRVIDEGSFQLISSDNSAQAAIIQYQSGKDAVVILSEILSVNVRAYCDGGYIVPITVSLWYTSNESLPSTSSNDSLVTGLDANGYPTVVSGWNEVPIVSRTPFGLHATALVSPEGVTLTDYPFTGWNLDSSLLANDSTFFAIVVGTGVIANSKSFYFNSVSLVPGNIATKPGPQTSDEVLRDCQYYYEKSYENGVLPGTASTFVGSSTTQVSSTTESIFSINTPYKVKKISIPTVTWYSPSTGSSANIYVLPDAADFSVASNSYPSSSNTGYVVTNSNVTSGHAVLAQWVADSRLGV